MRLKASYIVLAVIVLVTVLNAACKKTRTLTVGGTLTFSADTLKFDTVFTAAGSFTNGLVIYNKSDEQMVLSSVKLQHGATSYFHLNVDGFAGNNIPNLKIAPHDSIYVFATVNINPNDTLTPFLISDSLVATLNGRNFYVPFTAYGQNAYYEISDSINTVLAPWKTDKPHVVIHSCVIGPNGWLQIPVKCKVYMHQDARFIVYGGLAIGQDAKQGDSIVIQGDRLDRAYFGYMGYPGEWGGILFVGGGSLGYISNAVLENCGGSTPYWNYSIQPAAIEVDSGSKLYIDHSIVRNSIGYGLLGLQGSIVATNCLVHTCGAQALGIIKGGYDTITNCTFATYGTAAVSHINNPTVGILNYLSNGDGTWQPGDLNAVLTNCIVYGSLDSELYADSLAGATAVLVLDHCLFGTGYQISHFVRTPGCLIGQAPTFIDPLFTNPNNGDFHLQAGSPAIGVASFVTSGVDLGGKAMGTDLGCYQH